MTDNIFRLFAKDRPGSSEPARCKKPYQPFTLSPPERSWPENRLLLEGMEADPEHHLIMPYFDIKDIVCGFGKELYLIGVHNVTALSGRNLNALLLPLQAERLRSVSCFIPACHLDPLPDGSEVFIDNIFTRKAEVYWAEYERRAQQPEEK